MFKNLLKVAIRNFRRQIGFSLLNILGLTIGMASFILIVMWIGDELSYGKSFSKANRIHLVYKKYKIAGQIQYNPSTPVPLGPRLKQDFSEIEGAIRIAEIRATIQYKDQTYTQQDLGATDPDYINMFELEFVLGDAQSALAEAYSIIISEDVAKRYFDNENPLGKVLRYNKEENLTVTGVFKNLSKKSRISHDLFARFDLLIENDNNRNDWGNHRYLTMILLYPDAGVEALTKKMSDLMQEEIPEEKIGIKTLAFDKLRLYTIDGKNERIQYVKLFIAIAVFIILIACINFMNLSTARATRRSKEIGLRKVVGAGRKSLIIQFISEALVFSFISIFLAMMCVELFRPLFNKLTDKQILIDYSDIMVYVYLLAIVLFTGLISGSYPAFVMSSFKPIVALKSTIRHGKKGILFRKILVIMQFAISIFLIISTLFIYLQIKHIQTRNLGFDEENIIFFTARGNIGSHFETFKNELNQNKGIINISRSNSLPNSIYGIFRNVRWEEMEQDEGATFGAGIVDYNYFETMKMEIVEGRSFSREYGRDSVNVMFNQTAIDMIGFEDPVGKSFGFDDDEPGKIIGVVKDFNSLPLTDKIEPVMFVLWPDWCRRILVRIQGDHMESAITHIEKIYKEYAPEDPFNYEFLDKRIEEQYQSEQKIGILSAIFSLIAIIISCLGLFGLAAYTAEQKKKEMGIRKVFGADVFGIIYKLSTSFTVWVIIANIIAWPIAWLVMNRWLQNFAYHIQLSWWIFAIAGIIAILIALITVISQSLRVARKNPADVLRYEN